MNNFLLLGKTGVGKSSFINSTFGFAYANTDPYEPCTQIVEYFAHNTRYGDVCLIDTPGFADQNTKQDLKYWAMIDNYIKDKTIDAVLYLTRLDETRLRGEEKKILQMLVKRLHSHLWSKIWLILTFAAQIKPDDYGHTTFKRIALMEDYIDNLFEQVGQKFYGFQKYITIDNVKTNWHTELQPLSKILCRA
jgi:GTP-binding protein EngB required for normal cell division